MSSIGVLRAMRVRSRLYYGAARFVAHEALWRLSAVGCYTDR
jgi:hypothetical protein